jgi:hypothetical protein
MTDALAARPSFLEDQRPPIAVLARQAVASGDLTLVGHLVDHLLHPGTAAADLPEVVTALVRIGRPEAVLGLATFVRRYHADPQVVNESPAVLRAITGLLELTHDQSASADIALTARAALQDVADDPFTDGSLRGYIAGRLAPTRGDEGADEPPDAERPPRLTALSDPGL